MAIGSSSDLVRTAISPASTPPAAKATMTGSAEPIASGRRGQPEDDRLEPEGRPESDHPCRPAHERATVGDLLHDAVRQGEDEGRRERAGLRQVEPERPEERLREGRSHDDPEDRESPKPTAAISMTRTDGQRRYRLAAGARSPTARTATAPSTRTASARRQIAGGETIVAQSAPVADAAGGTIKPQHRLRATGTGAAQAQRTGASRRIATRVPATSATSTARRVADGHREQDEDDRQERARSSGRFAWQDTPHGHLAGDGGTLLPVTMTSAAPSLGDGSARTPAHEAAADPSTVTPSAAVSSV